MPYCSTCGKSQARFKNDGSLCASCFNDHNVGQVKSRMNVDNDNLSPQRINNNIDVSNDNVNNVALEAIDLEQKVGDISTRELMQLFGCIIKPLEEKIDKISNTFSKKIASLEKRADIFENSLSIKNERISQLTNTVINMQQALNSIDTQQRAKNVIMTGLTEEDILIDGVMVTGDVNKIKSIFKKIEISDDVTQQDCIFERIGKETGENCRAIKITVRDNKARETIIKNAPKLKSLNVPLSKIYINRDTHPVYRKEHQRLRKKLNELRKRPDLQETGQVKIIKGELIVNDVTIDRNIFLN